MPDLFKVNAFLNFYMKQYDFLEITFNYEIFSGWCRLFIYDKEKYSSYTGEFKGDSDYMSHINGAIIDFLAERSLKDRIGV